MSGRLALLIIPAFAFLCSLVLTGVVRRRALTRGLVDVPNARSSHTRPTPRGGGLAIVVATNLALIALWPAAIVDMPLLLALVGGGTVVALTGFLDDHGSLPVLIRIPVHFVSAIWAVWVLGGLPALQWGAYHADMGLLGDGLAVLAVMWLLNLFNFMDGIDGIAASEALFVAGAGAAIGLLLGLPLGVSAVALAVAAASGGFLFWNWPPARIFMGDVGSGYLGFVLAVLALAAARENSALLFVWLILGGIFFVDATVTLIRRLMRGERVYEAHRTHAYQWLARRWHGHLPVTLTVMVVNMLWLAPWAWWGATHAGNIPWYLAIALLPLTALALVAGAGRKE